MIRLAYKNILFRKMRAILTVVGIASSIMLAVLMSAVMTGTERTFKDSIGNMGGMIRIQPKSDALSGTSIDTLPGGLVLTKASVDEVFSKATGYDPAASAAVLSQVLVAPSAPNNPPRMVLSGIAPGKEGAVLTGAPAESGESKLTGEYDVILGFSAHQQLSETAGRTLAVGDSVTLPGAPGQWVIKGILKARDAYTDASVVVPLATAQTSLKRGDGVSYVTLSYPVDKAEAAAEELKSTLPDVDVVTTGAMLQSVNKALTAQRQFMALIKGAVYATAVAIIFMVMYTSVMERTKEIGTMRAVGASRATVVGGVLVEAAVFSLLGAVIGITITWFLTASWRSGGGFITPKEYTVDAIKTMGTALLIALISALYPSLRAARVNPLEALRYE